MNGLAHLRIFGMSSLAERMTIDDLFFILYSLSGQGYLTQLGRLS